MFGAAVAQDAQGVRVTAVVPDAPAALAGLQTGDVITAIGTRKVSIPGEFIVGRLDVQGVIYDRHSYVSQDGCESPVITDSYVWPNKILVWTMREKGLPNPPTDRPELDRQLLVEKLESVRRKTILGLRREFRVNKNGELVDITIQNQWVVAYGHTFYSPHLQSGESCREFGCKGFLGKVPLIITIDPKNIYTINEDGTFSDFEKQDK